MATLIELRDDAFSAYMLGFVHSTRPTNNVI